MTKRANSSRPIRKRGPTGYPDSTGSVTARELILALGNHPLLSSLTRVDDASEIKAAESGDRAAAMKALLRAVVELLVLEKPDLSRDFRLLIAKRLMWFAEYDPGAFFGWESASPGRPRRRPLGAYDGLTRALLISRLRKEGYTTKLPKTGRSKSGMTVTVWERVAQIEAEQYGENLAPHELARRGESIARDHQRKRSAAKKRLDSLGLAGQISSLFGGRSARKAARKLASELADRKR